MYILRKLAVASVAGCFAALGCAATQSPTAEDVEGLAPVASGEFQQVLLRPGADFRGYARVMLDPPDVTFRPGWREDMNRDRIALLQGTSREDADRLAAEVGKGLNATLASAFARAGFAVVATPGPGVLRLSPRIADLYVNAPRSVTTALPGRVYTLSAGRATLVLDVRDADSGVLLGRVVDSRIVGDRGDLRGSLRSTTTVTNLFDFERAFQDWSRGLLRTLAIPES